MSSVQDFHPTYPGFTPALGSYPKKSKPPSVPYMTMSCKAYSKMLKKFPGPKVSEKGLKYYKDRLLSLGYSLKVFSNMMNFEEFL